MKLGLKGRFLIPTMVVLIVGLGLSTAVGSLLMDKTLKKNICSQLTQTAGLTVEKIDGHFKSCKSHLVSWSRQKIFQTAVQDSFVGKSARAAASEQLGDLLTATDLFTRISVVNLAGDVVASSDPNTSGKVNVSDRGYFKQALEGKVAVSDVLKSKTDGKLVVIISVPLKENGGITGAVYGNIELSALTPLFIDSVKVGEEGRAFIIQDDGIIIAGKNEADILAKNVKDSEFGREMMARDEGWTSYSQDGKKRLLSYKKAHEAPWITGVMVMEREMLAPVKRLALINMGVALAVILVAAIVILLVVNGTVTPINKIAQALMEGAEQVAIASTSLASASQELADGSSRQAASLEETSAAIDEMASMVRQNADNSEQAAGIMKEASLVVDQANASMGDLTFSMGEISKASEETNKIVRTIDEIAFQTNLLALNAAVEAARAGEAGAGFAVVADEVRSLAMRAAGAARNTADLIDATVRNVKNGAELVMKTEADFRTLGGAVKKSEALILEISSASREQAQGIEQISRAVTEMDQVTQENAATAEESASASEEMNAQSEQMKESVAAMVVLVGGMAPADAPVSPRKADSGEKPASEARRIRGRLQSVSS